jgi:hypothetical protein
MSRRTDSSGNKRAGQGATPAPPRRGTWVVHWHSKLSHGTRPMQTGNTGSKRRRAKKGIPLPESIGIRLAPPPTSGEGQLARLSDVDAIARPLRCADATFVRNVRGIVQEVFNRYPYVRVRTRRAAKVRRVARKGGAR